MTEGRAAEGTAGPKVSVVIPAYNSAAMLPATLRTVIDQTEIDWEALVVDDCSADDPAAAVVCIDRNTLSHQQASTLTGKYKRNCYQ